MNDARPPGWRPMLGSVSLLLVLGLSTAGAQPEPTLYYALEEDFESGGNLGGDGLGVGAPEFVDGAPGSSTPDFGIRFNGSNYIDTGLGCDELGITNSDDYTTAAWVKFNNQSGDNMIFGQENSPALHNGGRNANYHHAHWGNDIASGQTTVGEWKHIAFVYQGGTMFAFEDGQLIPGSVGDRGQLTNPGPLFIGRTVDRFSNMSVDDVVVYDEPLGLSLAARGLLSQAADHFREGGSRRTRECPR